MIKIHGFTLIEILIAIAILGIVASLAIPSYSEYMDRARNAQAMSDIAEIQSAVERFYIANSRFPNNLAEIGFGASQDPWDKNYIYTNLIDFPRNIRRARRDQFNLPINSDYDLYSSGKDKLSSAAVAGTDDVIRARNGQYIGLGKDY